MGVPAFCFFVAVRWKYFISALARDQDKLKSVAAAPAKVQAMKHRKEMQFRKTAEKVLASYMHKYMRCELVEKPELAQAKINEFRAFVAP